MTTKADAKALILAKLDELYRETIPEDTDEEVVEGIETSWDALADATSEPYPDAEETFTHVQVYRDTVQSMGSTPTIDTVNFTTTVKDELSEYSSGVVTLDTAGIYVSSWRVLSDTTTWVVGDTWVAFLSVDDVDGDAPPGKRFMGHRWIAPVTTGFADSTGSVSGIYLPASSTLEIKIVHDRGSATNTYNSAGWVWWQLMRIR